MTGTTRRSIEPDHRWRGLVGLYGGYVAALFADASAQHGYHLASLDVRFLATVSYEPIELAVVPVHRGRRSATTRLRMDQSGRTRAEASAVLLRHQGETTRIRSTAPPREGPPHEYTARPHDQGELAFAQNLDVRGPSPAGLDQGITAWLRLTESFRDLGLSTPQAAACVLLDALLPVLFAGDAPPAFVPTIEFGYTFTPGVTDLGEQWFVGQNHLDWLAGDFCAEDAELTDASTGTLIARQRQLRSVQRSLHHDLHAATAPTPKEGPR